MARGTLLTPNEAIIVEGLEKEIENLEAKRTEMTRKIQQMRDLSKNLKDGKLMLAETPKPFIQDALSNQGD